MADSKLLNEQELMLKRYESPFTWNMPTNNKNYVDKFLNILNERCNNIEEENNFKWTSFNIHLVLSYEFWKQKGDYVNAMLHVNTCLEELQRLTEAGCREQLFLSINAALWHVTLATKANLHHINKDLVLTSQLISKIEPKSKFTKCEAAGILGIRAAVYRQYKPFGFEMALEMAVNASTMDPQQAEWHFITANCLGRIRRLKKGVITNEELDEMKKAFTLQKDATYTVHMAQTFTDFACYIYHNRYNTSICSSVSEAGDISKTYSKKAVELYRNALAFRPYCPGLKLRMAHGLMRIPDLQVVDYQWAKKLLDEASVHLPESAMLYHDLGRYYDRFEIPDQAIWNLKKAHELHNYPAFIYLIVLWWKYNCDWDLVTEIEAALDQYLTDDNQAELNVFLGTAQLLIKDDWESAIECYVKSLDLDPQAKFMKKFCGFYWREKSSLLNLITNQLRIKIKNGESVCIFITFLEKVYLTNPHLQRLPLKPTMYNEFKTSQLTNRIRNQEESSEETESEY